MIPIEKIIELHDQGLRDKEIAGLLGCARSNISKRLAKINMSTGHSKKDDIEIRNRISQSLIGRYVGSNNPNYKGCRDEKIIARGVFKTFSKRMIREYNFTCSVCGKKGGNLETHHIKPFHIIFDEFIKNDYDGNIDTIYNQLMNYDEFIDEKNMVVLCENCHRKVHYSDNPELSPLRWESPETIEIE